MVEIGLSLRARPLADEEIDPYSPIRPMLLPQHATLSSDEITVILGPMPATIVLHQLLNSPELRRASLATLSGSGGRTSVRFDNVDIPVPRYLRLLSRLCREVAASAETEGSAPGHEYQVLVQSETPPHDREFRLDHLPAKALAQFSKTTSSAWKYAVGEAIGAGVRDPKRLADIIFFMQHRDRIANGVGRLIEASEPEFVKLRAEWDLYEIIANRRLNPKFACSPFLSPVISNDYESYIDPPTTGRISLLINGRSGNSVQVEAFDRMQQAVQSLGKGDSVYLAAFMLNTTKLTTPISGLDTWTDLFARKAQEGVKIRILLTAVPKPGPNWGSDLGPLNQKIGALPEAQQDNLKYVVSKHPATVHATVDFKSRSYAIVPSGGLTLDVATHHQKFMVVKKGNETIAFCGGLDISPERIPPASGGFVWHDTHARLDGRIARGLEREFVSRWNREKDKSVAGKLTHWTPFEALRMLPLNSTDSASEKNTQQLQMLRTVSVGTAPHDIRRDDVWQSYFRLIGCATRFLILENQYFHEPTMADAIVKQTEAQPGLSVLIVVSGETDDPDNFLTENGRAQQNEFFTRLLNNVPPERVRVYSMQGRLVHSKLIMADDQLLCMGSTNADPRDFFMDTQLNVVLRNAEAVTAFRRRQWAHNLGVPEATVAGWLPGDFFTNWDNVAKANESRKKTPEKMQGEAVVPFDPRTVKGKRNRDLDLLTEVSASVTMA
jgi:phosphatidylserine/phosphatidylglycerophosphate/cardiolipin synthase-like enzyme